MFTKKRFLAALSTVGFATITYGSTYRAEDGLIKVRHEQYQEFGTRFGSLTYKEPVSYYPLVVEYRCMEGQTKDSPGSWSLDHSGAMLLSQDPRTMELNQNFPLSIEAHKSKAESCK